MPARIAIGSLSAACLIASTQIATWEASFLKAPPVCIPRKNENGKQKNNRNAQEILFHFCNLKIIVNRIQIGFLCDNQFVRRIRKHSEKCVASNDHKFFRLSYSSGCSNQVFKILSFQARRQST